MRLMSGASHTTPEVLGTVAMVVGAVSLGLRLFIWRRRPAPVVINVTTMTIRFWPHLLWWTGLAGLIVGTTALTGGSLDWLTLLGGAFGLVGWTCALVVARRYSPRTIIYDPDKPGL